MQRIIKELNVLIDNKLYHSSLFIALSLIDICSKIEYPSIKGNATRYKKWVEAYYKPYYSFITPNNMYKIRCNILHEGTTFIDETDLTRVIITRGLSHQNSITIQNSSKKFVEKQVNVKRFIEEILFCISEWSKSKSAEKLKLDFNIDETFSSTIVNGFQGFYNCR